MKTAMNVALLGVCVAAVVTAARADEHVDVPLELSKIFQSNMVLQRERTVRVWGKAPLGEKVTVTFGGQSATSAAVGTNDLWEVSFPEPFAANATGRTMTVTSTGGATLSCTNVLVGDVWIASGQSNMVMPVEGSAYGDTYDCDIYGDDMANHPTIRWTGMDVKYGEAPTPEPYEVHCGTWMLPKKSLSAVAYHFAHDCVTAHPDVPVAIIGCYCNALAIAAWQPGGTKTLWNRQLAPITKLAMRGAIWYQGETDAYGTHIRDHRTYGRALTNLVTSWRREFNVKAEDFPFYFVQLAGYLNGSSADDPSGDADASYRAARESMFWARFELENCGMTVAWDCGRRQLDGETALVCQHPRCKNVLGSRLALLALKNVYGDDVVAESPYWTGTVADGLGNIRISFNLNGAKSLCTAKKNWDDAAFPVATPGDAFGGFAICGSDTASNNWYWADAVLESTNTLRLSSAYVPDPKYVRYCYRCNPVDGVANVYSDEMLPVAPVYTAYKWYDDVRIEEELPPGMVAVPAAKNGLAYTGAAQTGVAAVTNGYTVTGGTATDAGSYTATATLASGYYWPDGSTHATNIAWKIAKGVNSWTTAPTVTPSTWAVAEVPDSIVFSTGANKFGAAVTHDGNEAALKALAFGESATVTFTAAGCANYDAITRAVKVTVTAEPVSTPARYEWKSSSGKWGDFSNWNQID